MEQDISKIWENFMKLLRQNSRSEISFSTWFQRMVPKEIDKNNNKFIITVPNEFIKNYLSNSDLNMKLLSKCMYEASGIAYEIEILAGDDEDPNSSLPIEDAFEKSRLNPKYIFENFIVGKSNEFAHAASLAAAESYENPEAAHSNPLFIYGGVGLGKTHLMQAIGHFVLQQDISKKVLYVTSEQFMNELIDSIKNGRNEEFRRKYRSVDLLLIDDIQFIADKESTQEEFFHTFNALHGANKQIVLTSDKPPKDIKSLKERLVSRFAWGLVVDIGPPDLETRIAILRAKSDSEGFDVPENVINYIAENVRSNIRELEGALTRVKAFSKLTKGVITEDIAKQAIKDIYKVKTVRVVDAKRIKEVISKNYNITIDDILSSKRTANIAFPRQIAMYLTRTLTDLSLPMIGQEFGGRDHTTVMYAINKIDTRIKKDSEFSIEVQGLIKEIKK